MTYIVLDPNILHVSSDDWLSPRERDKYIDEFVCFASYFRRCPSLIIGWSLEIEALLFQEKRPPWVHDKNWSNQIWPIYYQLRSRMAYLDLSEAGAAVVAPEMEVILGELKDIFLRLIHFLMAEGRSFYFLLSRARSVEVYSFSCQCHRSCAEVFISKDASHLLSSINVPDLWPLSADDCGLLRQAISLVLERDMQGACERQVYSFDRSFLRRLTFVSDATERLDIVAALSRRLSMTLAEAGRDASLQDEDIHRGGVRRFRVSRARRIHYVDEDGVLVFRMYYGDGEHDDGL